jgi:DNA-binding transcriptional regulator YdaS (Cro superfamily)
MTASDTLVTVSGAGDSSESTPMDQYAEMRAALERAIEAAGGRNALALALRISGSAISQWDICPSKRVLAVEEACKRKVTRTQLRPDIYGAPRRAVSRAS